MGCSKSSDVAKHRHALPSVALLLKLLPKDGACPTPFVPSLEQIRFIGIEHTPPSLARLTLRETRSNDVFPHGRAIQIRLRGNRTQRPAFFVQLANLLIACQTLRPPL